jgi:hypothetical protein
MRFKVGHERARYFEEDERLWWIEADRNVSDRYNGEGVRWEMGTRGGETTQYVNFRASRRFFGRFDTSVSHSIFRFGGQSDQTILTAGWLFNPRQSLIGRMVRRNDDLNAYLAFRTSGGLGTEYFLIVGDPNARTWQSRVSFKMVWAF